MRESHARYKFFFVNYSIVVNLSEVYVVVSDQSLENLHF